jgi:hypothetical protein
LGVPVITIAGIINLVYLAILFVFYVFMPGFESYTIWTVVFYAVIWGLGVAWYFFWKSRNKKDNIDVSMTYGELPPD